NMGRVVLPVIRKERSGHIFNIASIAGLVAMPGATVYSASKFNVSSCPESLAPLVAGFVIQITGESAAAFRPSILDDSSAHFRSVPLPEYKTFSDKICSSSANNNHKQPGAPEKLGQALVELALDPEAPLHFIVGSDAVGLAETQLASRKQEMQRWRN